MEKILDRRGEGMEDFIIWISVFLVGYLLGVLKGRRSIVREAQALVAEAIMQIREGHKV
jgi:spore maturation protein SpmA